MPKWQYCIRKLQAALAKRSEIVSIRARLGDISALEIKKNSIKFISISISMSRTCEKGRQCAVFRGIQGARHASKERHHKEHKNHPFASLFFFFQFLNHQSVNLPINHIVE
jgi:hypothetical protein